ncbi:salicylate hydroxylase [Amylostereum chailletii]|nr:salicylate hydroxylase [Amylostereum chailletii]
MSNSSPKLTVAICGGGIGGVTLACALSSSPDIQIDLYEAANKFGEIGAGLGIWWRGRRVLQMLGLDEEMSAVGGPMTDTRIPTFRLRKADQPEGLPFYTVKSRGGVTALHRADFHSILLGHLSSRCQTYNSKRLTRYVDPESSDKPITLFFDDGSTATCDVLAGADGLKSNVRQCMMQHKADLAERDGDAHKAAGYRNTGRARYSGLLGYRTVVSSEKLASISPEHRALTTHNIFVGKNCHIVAYPISAGRLVNVAIFCADFNLEDSDFPHPWVSQEDPQHVLGLFDNWELEVRQLVSCIEGTTVNKWAVNVVKSLTSYSSGRVGLLGDAAHAMTPLRGAGAGQAIEDAQILAAILAHDSTTKESVAQALQVYSRFRQPIASGVAEASRQNGMFLSLYGVEGEVDEARLEEVGKTIQANFDWYTEIDPADDVKAALELLESTLTLSS